tara:strand:+ start:177 stop:326 length:150 start_codon:yes stop_codon:yes gene_type:complete
MSKAKKTLSPILVTPAQRDWLDNEVVKTGNSIAAVIRNLIQEQANKAVK